MGLAGQRHPRPMGQSEEFRQNVARWRKEQQTAPVFLPGQPREQCEAVQRHDREDEPPEGWKVSFAPGEEQKAVTDKKEAAGPEWTQHSAAEVRAHHRLDGLKSEQTPGVSEGQGSLACCGPCGLTGTTEAT